MGGVTGQFELCKQKIGWYSNRVQVSQYTQIGPRSSYDITLYVNVTEMPKYCMIHHFLYG